MMTTRWKQTLGVRLAIGVVAGLAVAGSPSRSEAVAFTDVVVFGDSLSDSGNVSAAVSPVLAGVLGWPFGLPGPNYFGGPGFGRLSNGPVYAELVAAHYGLSADPFLRGGGNFAFAGSSTTAGAISGLPSIVTQVDAYAGLVGPGGADPNTLHILWAGANDLLDAADAAAATPGQAGTIYQDTVFGTVGAIRDMIVDLRDAGARTVVVPNLPDLGLLPRERGGEKQTYLSGLTAGFNTILHFALGGIDGIDIIEIDTFDLFADLLADPAAFGIVNTTDTCLSNALPLFLGFGTVCANPDAYLFWDDLHPTAAVHAMLADAVTEAIDDAFARAVARVGPTATPVPGSLIGLGVAVIALAAARQSRLA